jgi:hypothetical protein
MSRLSQRILHVACFTLLSAASSAQFYKLHDADLGVAATGQYTSIISSATPSITSSTAAQGQSCLWQSGASAIHSDHEVWSCAAVQSDPINAMQPLTTNSPGVLVSFRDRPLPWASVEVNYQYTRFSERYVEADGNTAISGAVNIPTNMQEATAAYLLRFYHHKRVNPFLSAGGGALCFTPVTARTTQWRGTGLVSVGVDLQTDSRLGFRIGARDLIYRAPTYALSSVPSTWVSTEEPYAGVYVKF